MPRKLPSSKREQVDLLLTEYTDAIYDRNRMLDRFSPDDFTTEQQEAFDEVLKRISDYRKKILDIV